MNVWQISIALGLTASTIASTVLWLRAKRTVAKSAFFRAAPPLAVRLGWMAPLATVVEVWMLWMGRFWS